MSCNWRDLVLLDWRGKENVEIGNVSWLDVCLWCWGRVLVIHEGEREGEASWCRHVYYTSHNPGASTITCTLTQWSGPLLSQGSLQFTALPAIKNKKCFRPYFVTLHLKEVPGTIYMMGCYINCNPSRLLTPLPRFWPDFCVLVNTIVYFPLLLA